MHYFKFNIGDYHKKAGRLSILEHGAYTLLILACYDREQFPNEDQAIDWCWARTDEEIAAVRFVLRKFFLLDNGKYVQTRIQEEIDKYHQNAITNKRIADEREARRKASKEQAVNEPCTLLHESPPNQEPRTNNQEPVTSKQEKPARTRSDNITLSDYLANCKSKGERAIPEDDPIFTYSENSGIPDDFMFLAWCVFRDKYTNTDKKYKDWKAVFRTAVKSDWLKLWAIDKEGAYYLTTSGKQAQAFHGVRK